MKKKNIYPTKSGKLFIDDIDITGGTLLGDFTKFALNIFSIIT